jgi:taurine dioxygenase
MQQTKIRITPETPSLGAVVENVDTRVPLSSSVIQELQEALLQYKVLFFRRQSLSAEELQRLANQFGNPYLHAIKLKIDDEAPGVTKVTRVPYFHSDLMYMDEPPTFSMLQMDAVPSVGGDTMWADLVSSYRDLTPAIKELIHPLTGLYVSERFYLTDDEIRALQFAHYKEVLTPERLADVRAASAPHEHPLVRVIPETNEVNYWLCAHFTKSIVGMSAIESDALLKMLFAHQMQPKYVYRWKWEQGDIAFWDHRTTLHSGVDDFGDEERHGQRASIEAAAPVGAVSLGL